MRLLSKRVTLNDTNKSIICTVPTENLLTVFGFCHTISRRPKIQGSGSNYPSKSVKAEPRPIDVERSSLYFAALLIIALVAFWPSYFAPGLGTSSFYIHIHAFTATLWMLMLIVQPWLVRTYRYELHGALGRFSFVLAPVLLISMLLLANHRLRTVGDEAYQIQTYILYLQVSLVLLFSVSYGLAIWYRSRTDLHARFMICTGLTLIDPVFARLSYLVHPDSAQFHQWVTFGLTDLVLLALIWFERRGSGTSRWVFPVMLCLFVVLQIPALFWLTNYAPWQTFALWFKSIPLT